MVLFLTASSPLMVIALPVQTLMVTWSFLDLGVPSLMKRFAFIFKSKRVKLFSDDASLRPKCFTSQCGYLWLIELKRENFIDPGESVTTAPSQGQEQYKLKVFKFKIKGAEKRILFTDILWYVMSN